jgi:hypothetical protein
VERCEIGSKLGAVGNSSQRHDGNDADSAAVMTSFSVGRSGRVHRHTDLTG